MTLDIAALSPLGDWRGRFRERLPGGPVTECHVTHRAPGSWKLAFDQGEVVVHDGTTLAVSGPGGVVALPAHEVQLILPFGVEYLSAPGPQTLARLLAETVKVAPGRREGREVHELTTGSGARYVLDAELAFGHEIDDPSLWAELRELDFGPPPLGAFALPTGAAPRGVLGRGSISVRIGPDAVPRVTSPPDRTLYVRHVPIAREPGPHVTGLRAALAWCGQRAEATSISVDEGGVRATYGRGAWRGEALLPLPQRLLGGAG